MTEVGLSPERFAFLSEAEARHFWFAPRRQLVAGILASAIEGRDGLLVDVGCGPGLNLAAWQPYAARVVGIDQHLTQAEGLGPEIRLERGTAYDLPIADGAAEAVLMLDVLEHVADVRALAEAHRILRAGGLLVASVPAHPWLWGARDIGADHLRRYSRRRLREVIDAAGFELVHVRPYQFLLFPAVVISRLLGKVGSASRDLEDRPPTLLNACLRAVNSLEVAASLRLCPMPTGSSFVIAARKRG